MRHITFAAPSAKKVLIIIQSNTWVSPPERQRAATAAAAKSYVVAGEDHAQYRAEFPLRVAHLGVRVSGPLEYVVCRKADPSVPHALG